MKIAVFVGPYPVYSETFVLSQIAGLRAHGHEVHIFAECLAGNAAPAVPMEGVRWENMPERPLPRLLGLLKDPPLIRSAIRAANPLRFGLDALSLRLPWTAAKLSSSEDFDIVYCHFGAHGRKAALLRAAGGIRGKVVTAMHGDDITGYARRFRGNVYGPLFKRGDLFLPVSEHGARELIQMGCPPERILVHRMGVDPDLFRPRLRCPERPLRIVTVARLAACKGIAVALAALANARFEFHYTIVGDGELRTSLEEMVCRLGLGGRVRFAGVKTPDGVRALLGDSDVFLLPSTRQANGDADGIPVAIMEAMACELAVISTWHGGIPELIADGVNGVLVKEGDVAALTGALDMVAGDAELRMRLGRSARETIASGFDSRVLNLRLVEIFVGLIASPVDRL